MGPFSESQGNKYTLLIGDQFFKWYDAVALPNQGAKTLVENVCWTLDRKNWLTSQPTQWTSVELYVKIIS